MLQQTVFRDWLAREQESTTPALGMFRRTGVEQLLLVGTGLDVQEQARRRKAPGLDLVPRPGAVFVVGRIEGRRINRLWRTGLPGHSRMY